MAIKIKTKTRSTSKPAPKPAAKPTAKRGTAATKRTSRSTSKPKAKAPTGPTRRSSKPQVSETQLNKWIKQLYSAGDKLRKTQVAHTEAVDNVNDVAQEALAAGVPMKIVHEQTGVSRQWLYKMGQSNKRDNGRPTERAPRTLDPEDRQKTSSRATRKPAAKAKASTAKPKATAKKGSQAKAGRARQATKKATPARRGGIKIKTR